ncbi:MAG: sodium:proton antiporter, partial [Flavobacteriales bacterium]|nr:sodium:proton antiporter [Flavobacteriales bacterium]
MIAHGVQLLSPKVFLVATCLVCAVVSLATGSSWSTAATVGIALIGVGRALDLNEGLVAGAVISGAYFGDKLSPLSDTTNLAPAVAGGELFGHIRYMLNTTLPSMGIALLLFGGIGLFGGPAKASTAQLDQVVAAIREHVHIGWYCYLPPVVVVVLIARRMAALPALFIGTLAGLVVAVVFQAELLESLSAGTGWRERYRVLMNALVTRTEVVTGSPLVDELLSAKGMAGMLETVWLIVCAMTFGGAMEGAGLLQRITREVMRLVKGDGSLIATTAASCAFVN